MPRMRQHGEDRRGVPDQNVDDALDVIKIDHWNARSRQQLIGRDGNDRRVVGVEQRFADRSTVHFELGMRFGFVAFDQHEIDGAEFCKQRPERGLGLSPQLVDEGPTVRRADQNFACPGHAMGVGILARLVDVKAVMSVLERRYFEPSRHDAGDDLGEERGLAGAAPAGEADDAHAAL